MSETFLDKMVAQTRHSIAKRRETEDLERLSRSAYEIRGSSQKHRFIGSLQTGRGTRIIAEIKRSSPSKGVINADINVTERATIYANGGAAAISVLTEPQFFGGSLSDLAEARAAVDTPILRKDFIVDELQVLEAAAAGADAVLLIVAALEFADLAALRRLAEDELGMDALVEVHAFDELQAAANAGARLIGVNNRNLQTLEVSLDVTRELSRSKPAACVFVAESGIRTRAEIDELKSLGCDAFLIGEALMRSAEPARLLEELGA